MMGDDGAWAAGLDRGEVAAPAGRMAAVAAALGAGYGLCMSSYVLTTGSAAYLWLPLVAALKVPALLFAVSLVAFPWLYVLNLMVGPRLGWRPLGRLLIATVAATSAALASLGPVVALFSLTTNYSVAVLLNVAAFGASGLLGLAFLLRSLRRLGMARARQCPPGAPTPAEAAGPRAGGGRGALLMLAGWGVVFGLTGTQVGWAMRPFIGWTDVRFALFRPREHSLFEGVTWEVRNLVEAGGARSGP